MHVALPAGQKWTMYNFHHLVANSGLKRKWRHLVAKFKTTNKQWCSKLVVKFEPVAKI